MPKSKFDFPYGTLVKMKTKLTRILKLLLPGLIGWMLVAPLCARNVPAPPSPAWLLDTTLSDQYGLYWATEPGQSYDLWWSTDLEEWSHADGFPKVAKSLALEHLFVPPAEGRAFFRIEPLDEQPPVVRVQHPVDGGFAVGRFDDLVIELDDASGLDPGSIRLTVGDSGTMQAGAPGITIAGNTITYNSGDAALGGWGETIAATLVAADLLGNTLTHTWSFRLELEPVVAENVFVFGSPTAQRAGQKVEGPTAALAQRLPAPAGPVKANDPPEWGIDSVEEDRVVIAYGGGGPPAFAVDLLICNLTPRTVDEIFYRRILSLADDAAAKRLTLFTEDASLERFIQQGSVRTSPDSFVYEVGENGELAPARDFAWGSTFPSIGPDLSGNSAGPLHLDEAYWKLTPTVRIFAEVEDFELQSFEGGWAGAIRGALVPSLKASESAELDTSATLAKAHRVIITFIGALPVVVKLDFVLDAEFTASASAQACVTGGLRWNQELGFTARFFRGKDPSVSWSVDASEISTVAVPLTHTIDGQASAQVKLKPTVTLRLYALAGVRAGLDPRFGVAGEATIKNGELDSAEWSLHAAADLKLGLDVRGIAAGDLPSKTFPLYSRKWVVVWPEELVIREQPRSRNVAKGGSVTLDVVATGPGGAGKLHYQWHHNGRPLPGRTDSRLALANVDAEMGGAYHVRVSSREKHLDSEVAVVSVDSGSEELMIREQPQSRTVEAGGSVTLEVVATGPGGAEELRYQWFHNGSPLPGGTDSSLTLVNVDADMAGAYHVRISFQEEFLDSDVALVTVDSDGGDAGGDAPAGFVLIPGGPFQMGDATGVAGTYSDELPVHTVEVDAFHLAKNLVTKERWDEVRDWGLSHGYIHIGAGNGSYASKGPNHPVHSVTWHDVVMWCNAASEKEGLEPCYKWEGNVYRNWNELPSPGGLTWLENNLTCDWTADGHRLPTEAEWEKAARGGLVGRNFPWGDTIGHAQANYESDDWYSYDVSPASGHHPEYAVGGKPYTSPVGAFPANGYGLHDMAGNLREWCWDWYSTSSYSAEGSGVNPRGPVSGSSRVVRGGYWDIDANRCRVSYRFQAPPFFKEFIMGFRPARGSVP